MMDKSNARFSWSRRRLGLTLEAAAHLTGHPIATLKGWSRGRRAVPRAVLRLLAAERLRRFQAARLARALEALATIQEAAKHLARLQKGTPSPVSSSNGGASSSSPNILAEIQ